MEILSVKNLSFTYPQSDKKAIDNITFAVNQGDFVVVCGQSGSGKTTLLKMLKPEITPIGEATGEVLYKGKPVTQLDKRTSAEKIGFVFQKPDQQIVTDKVWHELAFGLESLGYDTDYIRLRVGEMANYFGIAHMFRQKTNKLSGGQKQLMNLASVMAMSPDVLILDEPTSQLDPIAANDFIATLQKLNSELGLTIIIIEHRLQEVFPVADKVAVLESGRLIAYDSPKEVCSKLWNHPIAYGFPSAVRLWHLSGKKGECPLTVKEGRNFINENFSERILKIREDNIKSDTIIELKDAFFRYEKSSPDILRGTNISVNKGEHFCILGGNGSGKTTTLKILAGLIRPYRGSLKVNKEKMNRKSTAEFNRMGISLLPQNPEEVFIKMNILEDYREICKIKGYSKEHSEERIKKITKALSIENLAQKHPYDLSGGELQRCAMGKILLSDPKIILLDEPTKGMDAFSKNKLAKLLKEIKSNGVTVITVTHDIEFAASVADRCGMFFDGEILSKSVPQKFFSMNNFYTTSVSRIVRDRFKNAVTMNDVSVLMKEDFDSGINVAKDNDVN